MLFVFPEIKLYIYYQNYYIPKPEPLHLFITSDNNLSGCDKKMQQFWKKDVKFGFQKGKKSRKKYFLRKYEALF